MAAVVGVEDSVGVVGSITMCADHKMVDVTEVAVVAHWEVRSSHLCYLVGFPASYPSQRSLNLC